MSRNIPAPVMSLVANALSEFETHATLDSLFLYADATGQPPGGSKVSKSLEWMRNTNIQHSDPLSVVGRLVEGYMDDPETATNAPESPPFVPRPILDAKRTFCRKFESLLGNYGLRYIRGGLITTGASAPTKTLEQLIRGRDFPAIHRELDRALEHVDKEPRESLSSACNILESIFKVYIEDNGLQMPAKQDLQGVFKVVRTDLGLEAGNVEDDDLKKVLSGLYSIVDGIGALRTHASTAHGQGRRHYNIEPRHARLAINSAHSLTSFILETWDKRKRAEK